MPSNSPKQLKFFKLVKSYKTGGLPALLGTWKKLYGKRVPDEKSISSIKKTAASIKDADLEDMVSGIKGDPVLGDKRDIFDIT